MLRLAIDFFFPVYASSNQLPFCSSRSSLLRSSRGSLPSPFSSLPSFISFYSPFISFIHSFLLFCSDTKSPRAAGESAWEPGRFLLATRAGEKERDGGASSALARSFADAAGGSPIAKPRALELSRAMSAHCPLPR